MGCRGVPSSREGGVIPSGLHNPGHDDPQHALVILTGPNGGNAIMVEGLADGAGKSFMDGLANSRSPYVDSKSKTDLTLSIQAWTRNRVGYTPAELPVDE